MTGIVFGCIVPHPPIIIPDIGGGQEKQIKATTKAMEDLTVELSQHKPQTLVVISPHGRSHQSAMGILTAKSSRGSLHNWGSRSPKYVFHNDLELVESLKKETDALDIPFKSIGGSDYELDHGVMVPLHFLVHGAAGIPLLPLTFSWLPLASHFAFGQAIRRAAEHIGRRVAIIASGDLSHRLIPGSPAGYDPMGKTFDDKLVNALSEFDTEAILDLDPELIDKAGECGLRSIIILMGTLLGLSVRSRIISYEGPFGVGYLVASFDATELHPLTKLARETIECNIRGDKMVTPAELTTEMKEKAGVFVSLKKHGELRGCIGTFEPTQANVAEEIIANAVSSATRDPRFPPVTVAELPYLEYSVDVLSKPEPVDCASELDPGKYGVIVESQGRRGLLLPDLEGVDTAEHQMDICRAKAGITSSEPVKLYRFMVNRYK